MANKISSTYCILHQTLLSHGLILIEIQIFSCKKMRIENVVYKMVDILSRSQCVNSSPLVPHIYASVNWVNIGSGNGLSPARRHAITCTNADLLSTGPLGTHFSEIWIEILIFSFKKMRQKMSSATWRPFWPGGDELTAASVPWCVLTVPQVLPLGPAAKYVVRYTTLRQTRETRPYLLMLCPSVHN